MTEGQQGLAPRSRAPKSNRRAVKGSTIELLAELRRKHPGWGPRKLIGVAAKQYPELQLPAASTLGEHLKRRGLVKKRTRRERAAKYHTELGGYHGPNAVWCADYKGQFRCGNGKLCYPLTISDGYSRMLLRCYSAAATDLRTAKKVFDAAFREFGRPDAILTDNGSPFSGVHGVSQLSIWWVMLGIIPLRARPAKPSDNGRHERIHRTWSMSFCSLVSRPIFARRDETSRSSPKPTMKCVHTMRLGAKRHPRYTPSPPGSTRPSSANQLTPKRPRCCAQTSKVESRSADEPSL